MLCHRSKCLNHRSPSPVLASCGHGHGGGCAATHVALNLEEEAPPIEEQHVEEPILEELGTTQSRGEDAPPGGQ